MVTESELFLLLVLRSQLFLPLSETVPCSCFRAALHRVVYRNLSFFIYLFMYMCVPVGLLVFPGWIQKSQTTCSSQFSFRHVGANSDCQAHLVTDIFNHWSAFLIQEHFLGWALHSFHSKRPPILTQVHNLYMFICIQSDFAKHLFRLGMSRTCFRLCRGSRSMRKDKCTDEKFNKASHDGKCF